MAANGTIMGCACKPGYFGALCKKKRPKQVKICRPADNGLYTPDIVARRRLANLRNRRVRLPGDTFNLYRTILGPNCERIAAPQHDSKPKLETVPPTPSPTLQPTPAPTPVKEMATQSPKRRCDVTTCNPQNGFCLRNYKGQIFGCVCRPGFSGKHCLRYHGERVTLCVRQPDNSFAPQITPIRQVTNALNNGAEYPGTTFRNGEMTLGPLCERVDTRNSCRPNPCGVGGFCLDRLDGFVCRCHIGFEGKLCNVRIQ